ncbi:metal-sulfur cluster assembly factor [Halorarius halobius]|uniref:metal-sulfur cluster assembly factor n=1 Tax=Halorarius halobius TaxID=2962671 RepID=UPI0020CEF924|nr:metal-sulfur cluster assembly factor [Halorarius halobius]
MSEPVDGGPDYCGYTDYQRGVDPEDLPATGEEAAGVEKRVWEELYEVEDPEMPVSIVDLGLIYGVHVDDREASERPHGGGETAGVHATVTMTLTYTGCPARTMLQEDVVEAAERADGVEAADVELVWSPEWNLNLVTEAGKESLREFGVSI